MTRHAILDPDGDHAGNFTVEARTYGPHQAYAVSIGTEYGSAMVITTIEGLANLRAALDAIIGTEAPPAPAPLPGRIGTEVTELRPPDGRRIVIRVGDTYAVKPSRPRKRDGWVGVIQSLTAVGEVTITAPHQCPRTITVDRLGARKAVGK